MENFLDKINALIANCESLDAELKEIQKGKDFLINEYKTNKRWFREEPGKVTIEDVIKTCFEYGWNSRGLFEYHKNAL